MTTMASSLDQQRVTWMSQLEQNQKYLSTWRVLESPFDKRSTSEVGDATTAVSYGINANVYDRVGAAISADKITKPTAFIVFAPAQASTATVSFTGAGNTGCPRRHSFGCTRAHPAEMPQAEHTTTAQKSTQSSRTGTLRPCFGAEQARRLLTQPTQGSDPDAPYRWCP